MNPLNYLKSEIIRNTSVLITGTVIAQLISILLQPLLRRLYSAGDFGAFSVYLSMVGIIAVISTLRYDDAIVLPSEDKDSANLVILSQIYNLAINLILFIILLLFGKQILSFINLPSAFPVFLLLLIPAGAFLINLYQSFNYWLIRKKNYTNVSVNKLIRRGTEGAAQISFAIFKNNTGLIFSDIIGQTANVISTLIQSFKHGFRFNLISISGIRYVAEKYSEFPKFNLVPALMSTCSFLLPPIFINKFFSAENAGYFDASRLVLSIPLALVASSISNVLLQRIAERFNNRQSFLDDLKNLAPVVLLICLAEILVIMLFGPRLFGIAFGPEWIISGDISRIMVWSFVLNFFVSSFTCLFYSMRKIKIYSIWQVVYFLGIISLLFFKDLGFTGFLKFYVLIEVVCYLILTSVMVMIVMKYEKSIR